MTGSPEDRFWSEVIKGPRPDDCWLWTGAVSDDGYGRYWIRNEAGGQQAVRPQRYAHTLLTGEELDPGVVLMHSCDIPLCVRSTGGTDSHTSPVPPPATRLERPQPTPPPTAHPGRGGGLGRANFAAQSRELRDALKAHGWDESVIRPLMSGIDPDAPTLF